MFASFVRHRGRAVVSDDACCRQQPSSGTCLSGYAVPRDQTTGNDPCSLSGPVALGGKFTSCEPVKQEQIFDGLLLACLEWRRGRGRSGYAHSEAGCAVPGS